MGVKFFRKPRWLFVCLHPVNVKTADQFGTKNLGSNFQILISFQPDDSLIFQLSKAKDLGIRKSEFVAKAQFHCYGNLYDPTEGLWSIDRQGDLYYTLFKY